MRPFRSTALAVLLLPSASAYATSVGPQTELAITTQSAQRAPTISWDGTQYVIVFEDGRNAAANGNDLYVARLNASGALMDPNGLGLLENSVLAGNQSTPAIVYNPTTGVHLVAWVSAHLGSPDIFAARFLASSGTTIPSAGVIVTNGGPDAEGSPAVGYTANQYLITFQVIQIAVPGVSRIQARRLQLDGVNFADPAPFFISTGSGATFETEAEVMSIGNNFLVAWQDDRNGNTDLFARSMPDLGAVPATAGNTIFSGPLQQDSIALSPLGAGNLITVWEDASNTVDEDVAGHRFTSTLTGVGAAIDVTSAPNDQLDPKVAGDGNGALVVWQDRRNGSSNAITYAARLDASGNVLDRAGFPLLAYNNNSFEHAVVKGPNNDYLVVSVRFDATTPRIHYRIVRIEPPAGIMTAAGPTSVPADGVTTADLSFGPAVGGSGLNLVDGTLYTLMLSQPGVQIVAPDADTVLPGHQVISVDGEVYLQLRTTQHVMCDVILTSIEGSSSGMTTVEFANVPPAVSNVQITPAPTARSNEDLLLTYAYTDVNGDPELGSIIQWTRNTAVQGQIQGVTVPAAATFRGDQWQARVFPDDGLAGAGAAVSSNVVIIGNSRPLAMNLRIRPMMEIRTGTELEAVYVYDDPDGDAETGSELRWYDRGTERPEFFNETIIPADQVIKGQSWSFTVLPHDGTEPGDLITSPAVDVINTVPIAVAGMDGTVVERRSYQLDASGSSDRDPQDQLTYSWLQVENGSVRVQLSSLTSTAPTFDAPSVLVSEPLQFDLTVSDGEETSTVDRVVVTITPVVNSDPDNLDDEEEAELGTDPMTGDSDRDGLDDFQEVRVAMSNPLDADTDDDGVRDGAEGQTCRNCPGDPTGDADGDTVINALDPDADADGIFDGTELGVRNPIEAGGAAPYLYTGTAEAAGFFVPDADADTTTNPIDPDTDLDTLLDGAEDANHNGRIDDGESDPNDATDPGIPCTAAGNECPQGLTCGADNLCVIGDGGDGGPVCLPLMATLECCMGGCSSGSKVDPVCTSNGAMESCPIGADQCRAGSCDAPIMKPGDSGCACSAASAPFDASPRSAGWLALLFGLAFVIRSRSRAGSRR